MKRYSTIFAVLFLLFLQAACTSTTTNTTYFFRPDVEKLDMLISMAEASVIVVEYAVAREATNEELIPHLRLAGDLGSSVAHQFGVMEKAKAGDEYSEKEFRRLTARFFALVDRTLRVASKGIALVRKRKA